MLLPEFVDAHEHDSLVPLLDDGAAVGIVGVDDIDRKAEHAFAVGDRHEYHGVQTTVFDAVLDHRHGYFADTVVFAVESFDSRLMHAVDGFFLAHAAEFLFGEGCLDRKGLEKFKRQIAECGR